MAALDPTEINNWILNFLEFHNLKSENVQIIEQSTIKQQTIIEQIEQSLVNVDVDGAEGAVASSPA